MTPLNNSQTLVLLRCFQNRQILVFFAEYNTHVFAGASWNVLYIVDRIQKKDNSYYWSIVSIYAIIFIAIRPTIAVSKKILHNYSTQFDTNFANICYGRSFFFASKMTQKNVIKHKLHLRFSILPQKRIVKYICVLGCLNSISLWLWLQPDIFVTHYLFYYLS